MSATDEILAELRDVRQAVDRIEAKVDRIEAKLGDVATIAGGAAWQLRSGEAA